MQKSMPSRCILCEAAPSPATLVLEVTHTVPGTICPDCMALEPGERDRLRSRAMTRMLRTVEPNASPRFAAAFASR